MEASLADWLNPQCKPANELLVVHGTTSFRVCIETAKGVVINNYDAGKEARKQRDKLDTQVRDWWQIVRCDSRVFGSLGTKRTRAERIGCRLP